MLQELKVNNFAIIDNLHIQFKPGLNILSGETGAGKSVLLKSLSLLMGQKSSSESIRTGAQQASIEGSFDLKHRSDLKSKLDELEIEADENILVVRRIISEDKSKIYLNGTLSTLNTLRDIVAPLIEVTGHSAPLIEMTGQHENRHLMSKSYHLDLLDMYVGSWELRHSFTDKFEQLQSIRDQIKTLLAEAQSKAQRLDFLQFQISEFNRLELDLEKDAQIEIEIKKLKHSAKLTGFVNQAEDVLMNDDDSAISRLKTIIKKCNEAAQVDPEMAKSLSSLSQAQNLIEDALYDLRQTISQIDSDPGRLDELESRLSSIRKLQKKYGPELQDVLKSYELIQVEIKKLESSDQLLENLKKSEKSLLLELKKMGSQLHQQRLGGSQTLARSVNAELLDLNMKGVTFDVAVVELKEMNSTGLSDVEFLTQSSPKDPKRPLAKFASGGELSRILLSLKRVVGSSQQPRTYLFDEVDTGVSGTTAEKVGRKLKTIAHGQQVICVTHLPQVAAFGDHHFYIHKSPQKESVSMEISELKKGDRVQEIARLISGEKISKTSLAHAEQLLSEARS